MAASLTVFDAATLRPLGRIGVGRGPCKVVADPATDQLYVANSLENMVMRISLADGRIRDRIPVERAPVGLTTSGDGRHVYVCNRGAGTISVLDARDGSETHRIAVGRGPGDCAVDPVTGRLLVSNAGSGTLTVVDRPWLAGPERPATHPAVGRRLPDFALPDLHTGRIRTTREWAEKKYVINFFASW
jgi:YVTN family beta-propeller protein